MNAANPVMSVQLERFVQNADDMHTKSDTLKGTATINPPTIF